MIDWDEKENMEYINSKDYDDEKMLKTDPNIDWVYPDSNEVLCPTDTVREHPEDDASGTVREHSDGDTTGKVREHSDGDTSGKVREHSEGDTTDTVHALSEGDATELNLKSRKDTHFKVKRYTNNILFIIAIATVFQGLGFFVASFLADSVPFLPTDPLQLIGIMYTVMGLAFITVSKCCRRRQWCRQSQINKCCFLYNTPETNSSTTVADEAKKND